MIKKISLALFFALLFGFLVSSVVSAQQPTPSDDQVNAIARQLYCPVCENIPLDVCPTTACAKWRELIRQKLSDGWNEQQIKDYFVNQYGASVLILKTGREQRETGNNPTISYTGCLHSCPSSCHWICDLVLALSSPTR